MDGNRTERGQWFLRVPDNVEPSNVLSGDTMLSLLEQVFMDASFDPTFTNIVAYREIAAESLQESETLFEAGRRPRNDGSGGHILTADPDRQSLKHSFIAIAFAGMYIEAA